MSDTDQAWAAPENAATEAPAPEVKQETQPEAQPEQQEERTKVTEEKVVPLAALHEARMTNRQLREAMKQQQEKWAQAEQRLNALYQSQQPKPPAFEENPAEHLRFAQEQQSRAVKELADELHKRKATEAQQAQVAQLIDWGAQQANEFRKQAKDFDGAYSFVRGRRASEYASLGYGQQQVEAMVRHDELRLIAEANASGQNPAEFVYRMAKATGYAAQAPQQNTDQRMDSLTKGVAASKTVGKGGQKAGEVTLESLANMSKSEFDEAMKSGIWEKLAG